MLSLLLICCFRCLVFVRCLFFVWCSFLVLSFRALVLSFFNPETSLRIAFCSLCYHPSSILRSFLHLLLPCLAALCSLTKNISVKVHARWLTQHLFSRTVDGRNLAPPGAQVVQGFFHQPSEKDVFRSRYGVPETAESAVLGQSFGVRHARNTSPPARSTGLCPVLWAGGFLFDARHRNSDLARQSARRKGEAKVGKGGKGEFCEGELVLDMCLPLYSTLQCF